MSVWGLLLGLTSPCFLCPRTCLLQQLDGSQEAAKKLHLSREVAVQEGVSSCQQNQHATQGTERPSCDRVSELQVKTSF